jgi:hypothetical protein
VLLNQFDYSLSVDDYPNVKVLLNEIFRSVIVIANWSLSVQFTGGKSTQVAGLMSIQAFTYEIILFIVRKSQRDDLIKDRIKSYQKN